MCFKNTPRQESQPPFALQNYYLHIESAHSNLGAPIPVINVEPTKDKPVPFDLSSEEPEHIKEKMIVAGNAALLLNQLGMPLEMDPDDAAKAEELFRQAGKPNKKQAVKKELMNGGVAATLRTIIAKYDSPVFGDVVQARQFITAKLVELATCGDTKIEIKALELLGKHSDIGVFTERSEITITHKNSADLEAEIKERIKRLLVGGATDVDIIPTKSLDDELGIAKPNPLKELDAELITEPVDD